MNNKISIIIPVYNAEKYLKRCIDSIIEQTYSDWELILVDDGSTDLSGKICDEYASQDKRITVCHIQNGGPSRARNIGVDKSKGDYIFFVDADDWIEPLSISDFLGTKGESFDIYFQNYVLHDSDGTSNIVGVQDIEAYGEDCKTVISNLICSSKFGWTWIKLFKSEILKKYRIKFREDCSLQADELFTLQYCQHIKSIAVRNKANYHYYIYDTSLTRKKKCPSQHLKVLSDIYKYGHRIGVKRIDDFYSIKYMQWLHNSVISVYKNSLAEYSGRDKRYKLINDFLNLYKVYHKSLKSYKKIKSKALYIPLWKVGSAWLIDIVLKNKFNSKFQSNDERPKE